MFTDEEIKEISEGVAIRQVDGIISVRGDLFDKRLLGFKCESETLNVKNDSDLSGDGFYPESLEQQTRFAWTEEDGNFAALVSDSSFSSSSATTFDRVMETALKNELQESNISTSVLSPKRNTTGTRQKGDNGTRKKNGNTIVDQVTSTSSITTDSISAISNYPSRPNQSQKVDKSDPRSRFHFVKYLKRQGRTAKLWECGICGREFQHQYTLMRHLPTHTDERNFHCDACGKSFRQLSTLSQHRAIHSADRPYSCEVCHKTFNRVSTLISHRKIHSNEKPYKCHLCPKGFHQKGNLRNHLFTHTNARPYRCNICNKGFNQQSNLVCHKNKTHSDRSSNPEEDSFDKASEPDLQTTEPSTSKPDTTDIISDQCEVTSSENAYIPQIENPLQLNWSSNKIWDPVPSWDTQNSLSDSSSIWMTQSLAPTDGGIIVEPINTYHMGVAVANRQTPFALLKPDHNSTPVLVKVVDTKLPGGKQMLVPATAEDLRIGGKIVMNNEVNYPSQSLTAPSISAAAVRVPLVATLQPRVTRCGLPAMAVRGPHHLADHRSSNPLPSPLDLSTVDLFETIDCSQIGPQITPVGHTQSPSSHESDLFNERFQEYIALSDSD